MSFDYLKTLGKAADELKTVGKSPLGEVARLYAKEAVDQMKTEVPKGNGSLAASLSFEFEQSEGQILIKFLADDYWDFINSGVDGINQSSGAIINQFGDTYKFQTSNPSPSMVEAFGGGANYGKNGEQGSMQNWMASKGLIAENGDYNSLAFAIAKSVKQKGIKSTPFMNNALSENKIQEFEQALLDAFESII
jgi:hypothetical protein